MADTNVARIESPLRIRPLRERIRSFLTYFYMCEYSSVEFRPGKLGAGKK